MKSKDQKILEEAYTTIQEADFDRDAARVALKQRNQTELPKDLGVDSVDPQFEDAMVEFMLNLMTIQATDPSTDQDNPDFVQSVDDVISSWSVVKQKADEHGYSDNPGLDMLQQIVDQMQIRMR